MLDEKRQQDIVTRVAEAAAIVGLRIAPIGSVYFLAHGIPKAYTKDLDAVVHQDDAPASLDDLERLARELGPSYTIGNDKASLTVQVSTADGSWQVDLLRGRAAAKKGFLPRDLLIAAAKKSAPR